MAKAAEARLRRIEELVRRLDEIPDPPSRDTRSRVDGSDSGTARRGTRSGSWISSSNRAKPERPPSGGLPQTTWFRAFCLLHDLHPDDLETRVLSRTGQNAGSAELVSVFEGVVRVRLTGGGCGLKESVEALVGDAAPDLVELIVEERSNLPPTISSLSPLSVWPYQGPCRWLKRPSLRSALLSGPASRKSVAIPVAMACRRSMPTPSIRYPA